jgi:hypothetical protein
METRMTRIARIFTDQSESYFPDFFTRFIAIFSVMVS